MHLLIKEQLKFHIHGEEKCFLLSKPLSKSSAASIERAILGKERDRQFELPWYEFIGAVYFSPALIEIASKGSNKVSLKFLGKTKEGINTRRVT